MVKKNLNTFYLYLFAQLAYIGGPFSPLLGFTVSMFNSLVVTHPIANRGLSCLDLTVSQALGPLFCSTRPNKKRKNGLLTFLFLQTGGHKRLTLFYKYITLKNKCEKVL